MKKLSSLLVIVLSLVLVTCLVFTGCNKNKNKDSASSSSQGRISRTDEDASASNSPVDPSSSQTPASSSQTPATSSQVPASSSQTPATSSQDPQTSSSQGGGGGSGTQAVAFFDFNVGLTKGDAMNDTYNNGFYTVVNGKYTTSTGGVSTTTGSQANYLFKGACQLGTGGSLTNKSIAFTVDAPCTIEVYVTRGSSSAAQTNLSLVNSLGVSVQTLTATADLTVLSFTIDAAGSYAFCVLDSTSSANVWGIAIITSEGGNGGGDDTSSSVSSSERDPDTPNYDN